jgi:hypothetical protein
VRRCEQAELELKINFIQNSKFKAAKQKSNHNSLVTSHENEIDTVTISFLGDII